MEVRSYETIRANKINQFACLFVFSLLILISAIVHDCCHLYTGQIESGISGASVTFWLVHTSACYMWALCYFAKTRKFLLLFFGDFNFLYNSKIFVLSQILGNLPNWVLLAENLLPVRFWRIRSAWLPAIQYYPKIAIDNVFLED